MAIFLLIFFLLLTAYGLLIDYYRRSWNSLPVVFEDGATDVRVTVVVAVRNEEKHIEELLLCLADQDYPKHLYEIVVVDDHSTDSTARLIKERAVVFLQLPDGVITKKKAIAHGVAAASGELIITTDADCRMGPSWVRTIASFYRSNDAKFIAAPVAMNSTGSISGIFQSLDFLTLQGITGASVYKRFHSMCNGANLAYTKAVFTEVNGFEGVDDIPSGDDMLLMHKIFTRHPEKVFYLKASSAIVTTAAEKTWKDFFSQRIRWASKAVHYKDKRIFYVLLLTYLVNICFVILAVAAFWNINWLAFFILLFVAKILIEFPFVNAVALFFGKQSLMRYFPFMQPLHILYTVISGWLGRFGSYRWKSRVVKNKP